MSGNKAESSTSLPTRRPPGPMSPALREARKREYLVQYEELGISQAAADKIQIDRTTVDNWKRSDPEFAEACLEAWERFVQRYEAQTLKDAFEGEKSPVFDRQGQPTGHVRVRKSDVLRMFFLKAWRPAVYKERYEIQPGQGDRDDPGAPDMSKLTEEELRTIARLEAKARGVDPDVDPDRVQAPAELPEAREGESEPDTK